MKRSGAAGWALLAVVVFAAEAHADGRRSGYTYMGPTTRAMQDDDGSNPGIFWVLDGAQLWSRKAGARDKSCADCHGDGTSSMRGVAARYPALDKGSGRLLGLEGRINQCVTERQASAALAMESRELLGLTAFVARQSRGMPVDIAVTAALQPHVDAGRALYERRQGQVNLSCKQCHDDLAGRSLAGNPIPQAHPTGYPIYRLEWQTMGSLQRRLRNCMVGTRTEPFAAGAKEWVELELYLMVRANGMKMESPGVRP